MNILIVDDNEKNLYQLQVLLGSNAYRVTIAANGAEALQAARQNPPDLIISDILMPVMDGFALCREWTKDERLRQIPFVFYTATYTDERDEEFALSLGAARFIVKPLDPDDFIRAIREVITNQEQGGLAAPRPPAEDAAVYLKQYNQTLIRKLEVKMERLEKIKRELEREITEHKQTEETLREKDHLLSEAQSIAHIGGWSYEIGTGKIQWCDETYRIYRVTPNTFVLSEGSFLGLIHPEDRPAMQQWIRACVSGEQPAPLEFRIILPDGNIRMLHGAGHLEHAPDHTPIRVVGTVQDVTERKQALDSLKQSEEKYRILIETTNTGYVILDLEGRVCDANAEYIRMTGHGALQDILHRRVTEWTAHHDLARNAEEFKKCAERGYVRNLVVDYVDREGKCTPVEINASILSTAEGVRILALCRDITERSGLEAQLRQAQKMELVGLLAGGVAHDFNNLLTVINGYADFLLRDFAHDNPKRRDLLEIKQAGLRAVSLISQLLAFSRRQIIEPKILDLNELIVDLDKMLRRLLGEDIDLVSAAAPGLGMIEADPGQIEQIIINLAVNARDAMPDGGKLIVETANVDLDQDYVRQHAAGVAGPYVVLAISDNGVGMDAETRARIFEPFFTTKGPGKGTGLGLSTVYGIVKQNGGFVWVYSEPGKGTTFKIYLPRVEGEAAQLVVSGKETPELRGTETVLVVEDESAVRAMAARILRERGYTVLEAAGGEDALRIARGFAGPIHLVLTDVVMPGMNGPALASQMGAERPGTKFLFVSGYTSNSIVHHGILDLSVAFLSKPFTADNLARKVRETIDSVA